MKNERKVLNAESKAFQKGEIIANSNNVVSRFSKYKEATEGEKDRTIMEYKKIPVEILDLNNNLEAIVGRTKSNRVISALKTMESNYSETAISIARTIGKIAESTKSKRIVGTTIDTIMKYKKNPETARLISLNLEYVVEHTKSEEAVLNAAKVMESETPEMAMEIASRLRRISEYTKSKQAVTAAVNTIMKYKETSDLVAESVALSLDKIAYYTKSKEAVLELAELFSSDALYNAIVKHKESILMAELTALSFEDIFEYTNSKEAVLNAANLFLEFENPETATSVVRTIGKIAESTKSKRIVRNTIDTIMKYKENPETAELIALSLKSIFEHTNSKEAVSNATKLILESETIKSARSIAFALEKIAYHTDSKEAVLDAIEDIKDTQTANRD
ncbi:MAG: hypothetical protein QW783_03925 [Candidatus Micrarchaeia archaeon]